MLESDDEFTELCSKILKRVKKNKPLEGQSVSTADNAAKIKRKRTKPPKPKSQASNGASEEMEQSIRTASGLEMPSDGDGVERVSAVLTHLLSGGHTDKDGDAGGSQEEAARLEEQPSVKHLVLERMQQYKRSSPVRMILNPTEADGEHADPHRAEADVHADGELAMALQMDLKEKPPSLEDVGLFFCQLCHKDLTGMSGSLREQHVNRCLDQGESVQSNSVAPVAPTCPLCGKFFASKKTRNAHLKRCAAKHDVPAQTLLDAVKKQAAETGSVKPPRVPSVKRKGVSKPKEPSKKRKVAQTGAEKEDLMVAMALSRSLQEESIKSNTVRALPIRDIPPKEKKSRRKQKDKPTPLLLVQAPEEAVVKLQKKMSMMLSEELVGDSLVTLPASNFWSALKEDRESCTLQAGARSVFWDISKMAETRENASYYTAELNPPITPWKGPKKLPSSGPGAFPPVTPIKPRKTPTSQKHRDKDVFPATPCRQKSSPSNSQKDKQALQDLVDLAGEGMTLTQWNSVPSIGRESPNSIVCSGFIPSEEEEPRRERLASDTNTSALTTLTTDFMEMVNNPHLSDAQLQTDCGEVLNVHMFVLYARCPLLVEAVHTEGFWVKEGSTGRVRRLLLNNVSAEAVMSFLCFLYSAKTDVPSDCLTHICELARRFGVKSLIDVCEVLVGKPRVAEDMVPSEKEEDDGGERAENFQELLKSMWVDEEEDLFHNSETEGIGEEEKVDDGRVEEVDLDEIYEFAATQRKMLEEKDMESNRVLKHFSPTARCQTVGNGEQHLDVVNRPVNRPPVESNEPIYIADNSPSKVLGVNKGVTGSPFGKPPAHLHSRNVQLSPAAHRLGSPARFKTQQAPGVSSSRCNTTVGVSPSRCQGIQGVPPSKCHSTPGVSPSRCHSTSSKPPFRQHPVNQSSKSSEGPSGNLSECSSQILDTISLISPEREEDPEADLFTPHSPSPLEDSYDRMFLETCGEYVEPSDLCETNPQLHQTTPQLHPTTPQLHPTTPQLHPTTPQLHPTTPQLHPTTPQLHPTTPQLHPTTPQLHQTTPQLHPTTPQLLQTTSQHESPILTSSPSTNHPPTLPELGSSPDIRSPKLSQNASNSVAKNEQSSLSSPKCGSSTQPSSSKALPATQSQGDIILIGSSDEEDNNQAAEGKGLSNRPGACKVIKKLPSSLSSIRKNSEGNSRLQMSSSSETSWLVPATPMAHSTAAGVSQLHASRLSQSPQTQKSRSQNELRQSFGPPSQKLLSPIRPAISPKKPLFFNKPPCSKIPEKLTKTCSSTSSKVSCVPSSPLSSTASSTVFEIVDSDEEKDPVVKPQTDTSACSFQIDYDEPPIPVEDDVWLNPQETSTKPRSSTEGSTSLTTTKVVESSCTITALQERDKAPHNKEESPNKSQETDKEPDNSKDSAIILQEPNKENNNGKGSPFILQKRDKEPDNRADSSFILQEADKKRDDTADSPLILPETNKEPDNRADSPLILPETDKEPDNRADSPLILPETDKEPDDDEEDSPSSLPDTDKEPDDEEDSPSSLPETDKEPDDEEHSPSSLPDTDKELDDEEDFPSSLPDTDKEPDDEEDSPSSLPETDKEPDDEEDSPSTPASQSSRQSYLNSKLWDEWEDELPELPEILTLSQRINQVPSVQKELKTPVSKVRKRELAPKVPITPQPGYSDMDTPVLKKELNKFGVRALPKKQMVLKLKEIYRYTHQVMSSDSEDDVPSSQPGHRSLSGSAQYRHLPAAAGTSKTSSTALLPMAKKSTSVCAAQEADSGDEQPSQESTASSVAASDTSSLSHSSNTNEFETAFADDDDDLVPPSQAASKEAQTAEAVRKFIEQRPDLHKRILLYQPLDLAALHAELKLNGIKMASGKLLDFLDAHCVTFTTAAARKEKKSRVRKRFGKQPGAALKKSSAKN